MTAPRDDDDDAIAATATAVPSATDAMDAPSSPDDPAAAPAPSAPSAAAEDDPVATLADALPFLSAANLAAIRAEIDRAKASSSSSSSSRDDGRGSEGGPSQDSTAPTSLTPASSAGKSSRGSEATTEDETAPPSSSASASRSSADAAIKSRSSRGSTTTTAPTGTSSSSSSKSSAADKHKPSSSGSKSGTAASASTAPPPSSASSSGKLAASAASDKPFSSDASTYSGDTSSATAASSAAAPPSSSASTSAAAASSAAVPSGSAGPPTAEGEAPTLATRSQGATSSPTFSSEADATADAAAGTAAGTSASAGHVHQPRHADLRFFGMAGYRRRGGGGGPGSHVDDDDDDHILNAGALGPGAHRVGALEVDRQGFPLSVPPEERWDADRTEAAAAAAGGANVDADADEEAGDPIIPEAYLVEEDGEGGGGGGGRGDPVIDAYAEPVLPWHKSPTKRRWICLGSLAFGALAVALGVTLARGDDGGGTAGLVAGRTLAPTVSSAPSLVPSAAPTDSFPPSAPPSACSRKVVSSVRKVDLPLDDPRDVQVDVDGDHMVVVAAEGEAAGGTDGPAFVVFYAREADGTWGAAFRNSFRVDGANVAEFGYLSAVSLSGKTAMVGFPYADEFAGRVLVFERDDAGTWRIVEDALDRWDNATNYAFGEGVDVDGDLACVQDYEHGNQRWAHLFLREDTGSWNQTDLITEAEACKVSGDTIAILGGTVPNERPFLRLYRYDRARKGADLVQDDLFPVQWFAALDMSDQDIFIWSELDGKAYMHRLDEGNLFSASASQQLDIEGQELGFGLALDNGVLAIEGDNETQIFSEQDGVWEESISFDKIGATGGATRQVRYAISGRTLIAATRTEVFSYDIDDCAPLPTQAPSVSAAPSEALTSPPSMRPSSSVAPSLSISPTTSWCGMDITVEYDDEPSEIYIAVNTIDDYGNDENTILFHQASDGDTSYDESLCLDLQSYKFVIVDVGGDGLQGGSYKVTVANGTDTLDANVHYTGVNVTAGGRVTIAEGGGGDFGEWAMTFFRMPYVEGAKITVTETEAEGRFVVEEMLAGMEAKYLLTAEDK